MWPLLAFAAMVVIVLVWLDTRLGPPPANWKRWTRHLPCGCTEFGLVRYTDRLNWASTRVHITPAVTPGASRRAMKANRREAAEVLRIVWENFRKKR
jgi:hypothetical protein